MIQGLIWVLLAMHPNFANSEIPASQKAFFQNLSTKCGAVYEGYSYFPNDPEDSFHGKLLVAEISSCSAGEIRIRFTVGEDRSRTWIFTLSEKGLLLKHDHRHEDGTPDEITNYGGWANEKGTDLMQFFPADDHTKSLLPAAATNVWQIAFDPKMQSLIYYLERDGKPRFKAVLTLKKSS